MFNNRLRNRQSALYRADMDCYYYIKFERNKVNKMKKYVCVPCGYEYDPEVGDPDNGIEPGTAFEDLPDDWVCPVCGVGKDEFEPAED